MDRFTGRDTTKLGDYNSSSLKPLNASAAWLAELSPITSPAPRRAAGLTADTPPTLRGYRYSMETARRSQPWLAATGLSASLYPHLVRSRSPPAPPADVPVPSRGAPASLTSNDSVSDAPTSARGLGTLMDALAREWPFAPHPSDSADLADAVRFGRQSALLHCANDGFKEVSGRLAREAGAVSMEAARYRVAAQYSAEQCKAAAETRQHTAGELAHARRRLLKLEQQERAKSAVAGSDSAELNTPCAAAGRNTDPSSTSSTSLDVLALQLDEELSRMRAQKQRYAALCEQRGRMEAKTADLAWEAKRLEAEVDRERARHSEELAGAMVSFGPRAMSSGTSSRAAASTAMEKTLRAFDVCLVERRELLRHLREGSADRLVQLTRYIEAQRARESKRASKQAASNGVGPSDDAVTLTSAVSTTQQARESEESSSVRNDGAEAAAVLIDRLSEAQQMLLIGEEEALAEMEHLRILMRRLQMQESSAAA